MSPKSEALNPRPILWLDSKKFTVTSEAAEKIIGKLEAAGYLVVVSPTKPEPVMALASVPTDLMGDMALQCIAELKSDGSYTGDALGGWLLRRLVARTKGGS